jgi:TolB-like protein/cytochrome c-type biogenesis protein CcmH/NrfG
MASGDLPFQGDTSAVIFEAILNRDPPPITDVNPAIPADFERILDKALEKDRTLRYQSATEMKTDLMRLKRDLGSGRKRTAGIDTRSRNAGQAERSVAVLYFENLSGVKEDEYFRDGITEDIITELSKIRGLHPFSRPTVLAYRDKPVTPAQIGQQLGAAYALTGSVRRSGDRLRINAQLIDTRTDFPVWSERYDRDIRDVFDVQDEIARNIAEALRLTLSPQEQQALADNPTEDPQAYDFYQCGKSYARRLTRKDLEFALQMFENAVARDPQFALAYATIAKLCVEYYCNFERDPAWVDRSVAASKKAVALRPELPEVQVAEAWILYARDEFEEAIRGARMAISRKRDCEGAYYLLCRALFAAGRYQEVAAIAEVALEASGEDYNVYVPIQNALGALGKKDAERSIRMRRLDVLEKHLKSIPEDARARVLLAGDYGAMGRFEDAMREANLAIALRPDEAMVLYNVACVFCGMNRKDEALAALKKSWEAGYRDTAWARRDPDLALLHDDPEFARLFPGVEPAAV